MKYKIAQILVTVIITISGVKGMETPTSNWILDQYPKGWTCLRDVENFNGDMCKYYYGEDGIDEFLPEEEYKKAVTEKERQGRQVDAGIKPIINTLYERTLSHLPKADTQDLILSILAFGAHDLTDCSFYEGNIKDCFHEAAASLATLRDAFIAKHKPATMETDEFIGKSLWSVQAECIRRLQSAPSVDIKNIGQVYVSNDFSLAAIELCLSTLRSKYNAFVESDIVPVLKGYSGVRDYLGSWRIK